MADNLIYSAPSIARAKRLVKADTAYAKAWEELRRAADGGVKRADLQLLDRMALAYYMTDSAKYADGIKRTLLRLVDVKTWGSEEMLSRKPVWRADLGLSHKCYLVAIGYDAVRSRLSSSERKKISEALYRLGLEPSIGDWIAEPTRIHSLNSMGHNWWTSCACMGGVLALALKDDVKEAAQWAEMVEEAVPQWFAFAGDVLQHKPKSFDDEGGMYESVNYANFGIQEALQFRLAWRNVWPAKKLSDVPQLANIPNFFLSVCYPHKGQLIDVNFGDSHAEITANSSLILLYELGLHDPDILWYLTLLRQNQDRDGYWLNRPMGFLYTPDLKNAPTTPSRPLSKLFADFGWATLRTSWQRDATMLAVKSGHTWNHSHADANSFILYHKGVDIIKDGGHCWYPNENYRKYFFQSQAHNVVLFNGEAQPTAQQYQGSALRGYLHDLMDAGSMRYLLADATGPTSKNFSRNFRHFLWLDNIIYVIDDLKTHEQGEFQWLWHYNGEAKKSGPDLTFTSDTASVVLRPLYPRMMALSNFVHDYPDDLYWEEVEVPTQDLKATEHYYSLHLPGKADRVKALTAIILKDSVKQKDMPRMERREGKDWIGLRVWWKGRVTDIYLNQLADGRLMHSNSWIEADGWQTDAYMLALTYKEGDDPAKAARTFVCYGSALRRGGKSFFSSLSKLNVMQQQEGGAVRLLIGGQPHGVATFAQMKKGTRIALERQHTVENTDGGLKIKF